MTDTKFTPEQLKLASIATNRMYGKPVEEAIEGIVVSARATGNNKSVDELIEGLIRIGEAFSKSKIQDS